MGKAWRPGCPIAHGIKFERLYGIYDVMNSFVYLGWDGTKREAFGVESKWRESGSSIGYICSMGGSYRFNISLLAGHSWPRRKQAASEVIRRFDSTSAASA